MSRLALALALLAARSQAATGPDWARLRAGWRASIRRVSASGRLPLVDLLSTFSPAAVNLGELRRRMDRDGIAVMALTPTLTSFVWMDGPDEDWRSQLDALLAEGSTSFLPVPPSGLEIVLRRKQDAAAYLDGLFAAALARGYPMLGEFRFRSYPSNDEWINPPFVRAEADVSVPIDGPLGEKLFAFSQARRIPFVIRYEPEDALLPALESMLSRHPGARVVWRSVGRVRDAGKAASYGPALVRRLLESHPNLYFDLSWTDPDDYDLRSRRATSALWDRRYGCLDPAWAKIIEENPWRFIAALGLDQDQIMQVDRQAEYRRRLLLELPPNVRPIVAYKAAWKLLFGEALP